MREKGFNWGPGLFLIIYQIVLLITLPVYLYFAPCPSWGMIITSVVLFYLSGLSITGGYHRYFAHKTYKTNPVVETILLFFGAMAVQGSALRWAFDHRRHHAHVDTDEDPYAINRGFWYAHFSWILEKPETIDPKIVPDLFRNKRVMFQHTYSDALMIGINILSFLFFGWLFNDYLGSLMIATFLRMFALHHFTWFINSLAHTWGDKPFSQEQSAVNNWVISLVTFGEGYHNYHHTFANDYRNGIRWFHFDPTKWLIWSLNKLGLASDLKKMDSETIRKRMIIEKKQMVLEHLQSVWNSNQEVDWEGRINAISEGILQKISALSEIKKQYNEFKKNYGPKEQLKEMQKTIEYLKMCINKEWHSWNKLTKEIQAL